MVDGPDASFSVVGHVVVVGYTQQFGLTVLLSAPSLPAAPKHELVHDRCTVMVAASDHASWSCFSEPPKLSTKLTRT